MIRDMILANRSIRRFDAARAVSLQELRELVELARFSGSAANLQPLKFLLAAAEPRNSVIFERCAWAGYLTDWEGPAPGERPTAYIVLLGDTRISRSCRYDAGIAAQSMLLGATERGLGGCVIGSIRRDELMQELSIPDHCEILLIIALGKPAEKVVIEDAAPGGDIRYWRDAQGVHHVPKRGLEELILD